MFCIYSLTLNESQVSAALEPSLLTQLTFYSDASQHFRCAEPNLVSRKDHMVSRKGTMTAPRVYSENFDFFKNTEMLCEFSFVLIPSVEYEAALDYPHQLRFVFLCSGTSVILPGEDSSYLKL